MTHTYLKPLQALLAAACILAPGRASAQLPFDITRDDLLAVDPGSLVWTRLTTHVGGIEGEARYNRAPTSLAVCKAAAIMAGVRMQRQYVRSNGEEPISLQLHLVCAGEIRGVLRYDGLALRLEMVDVRNGTLLYQGRANGFP